MKRHLPYVAIILLVAIWSVSAFCDARTSLVEAARAQVGKTRLYDPSYRRLDYPNGDVPMERGVCTDVVIRALRAALRLDLQQLVHEDMRGHFSKYPDRWGLSRPDSNIDHRRVPNLRTYFQRQGWSLRVSNDSGNFLPGDLVTCTVPPNLPHIMIVSDRKTASGRPLVIHNIGMGAQEEDVLFNFDITGHYRLTTDRLTGAELRDTGPSIRRQAIE